jgi:anti-sigma B factor antagonist
LGGVEVDMGDALTIGIRQERGYPVVTVTGKVDIASVAELRKRLLELAASGQPLVVDLDQASFIDSVGLGVLAGVARRAESYGGSLYVVCAQPQVRQLFLLTGLDRRIPLARTLNEAVQAFAAAQATPS